MKEYNEIKLNVNLNYGLSTFGTCDKLHLSRCGTKALLGDYKTGVSQIDHPEKNWQAIAYTIGVFDLYPTVNEVTFVFYIPFYNDTPNHKFLREELETLREEVSRIVARATYVRTKWSHGSPSIEELEPNQSCRFCQYEESCPALGGMVLEVADKLGVDVPKGISPDTSEAATPQDLESLWSISKVVGNWADSFRKNLVNRVVSGELTLPSLRLRSMGATKKVTDNHKLLDHAIKNGVSEGEFLEISSVPLGKLTKVIQDKAPKGEKNDKRNKFLDDLEQDDILQTSEERFTLS